jgi:hypothetical protein
MANAFPKAFISYTWSSAAIKAVSGNGQSESAAESVAPIPQLDGLAPDRGWVCKRWEISSGRSERTNEYARAYAVRRKVLAADCCSPSHLISLTCHRTRLGREINLALSASYHKNVQRNRERDTLRKKREFSKHRTVAAVNCELQVCPLWISKTLSRFFTCRFIASPYH